MAEKKGISFIDIVKIIIKFIPIIAGIIKEIKKVGNDKVKKEVLDALNDRDVDKLNELIGK